MWLKMGLSGYFFVWKRHKYINVRTSVCTLFPFDNLSIYKWISFRFCICICTNNVSLWIVNGQISIIYDRVMARVNIQKMVFGLYFTIWSIMMKLHKNDRSNKSSILDQKFYHSMLSALAWGYIHV